MFMYPSTYFRTDEGEGADARHSLSSPGHSALLPAWALQRETLLHHPSGWEGNPPSTLPTTILALLILLLCAINWAFGVIRLCQPKQTDTQPYQMAKKDSNGVAAYCKEDTIVEDKEMESGRQTEEEEDSEARMVLPSCQLTPHPVQETSLW